MADLVTIRTDGGVYLRVARDQAQRILDTINNVEMRMPINPKPEETAGYNYRNIAGTNILSNHATGRAVDVNASQNARGTHGDIRRYFTPDELAHQASDNGMTWGGTWKNPDDMHFEVARGAAPAPLGSPSNRAPASAGLNEVSDAGLQPLSLLPAYRSPFQAPPPAVADKTQPPSPVIAAALPAATPKETPPSPFTKPEAKKPAAEDDLAAFHSQMVQNAQRVAQQAIAQKIGIRGLSKWNDDLFGGAT